MRKISEEKLTAFINNQTFLDYLDRLRLVATSLFTWEGLDEVAGVGASRFLEQSLYDFGRACFIQDPELGFMALKVNPSDKLNIYNLPVRVQAWSIGYSKQFKFDDVVYIMNNELQLPTYNTLSLIAHRLYETERTIDVNLMAQKTPVLIEGENKTMLTLKQLYEKYVGNIPFVFGNKEYNLQGKLNVLKTDAPYLIDKLELHKHELWDEALTYLGINNANTDKKERLITDEVNSNNELINYYLNCFYKTRQKACEEINKKFFNGEEKIKIKINNDNFKFQDYEDINIEEEVDNGEVYDNN